MQQESSSKLQHPTTAASMAGQLDMLFTSGGQWRSLKRVTTVDSEVSEYGRLWDPGDPPFCTRTKVAHFIPDLTSSHSWAWSPASWKGKPLSYLFSFLLTCYSNLKFTSCSHTCTYCDCLQVSRSQPMHPSQAFSLLDGGTNACVPPLTCPNSRSLAVCICTGSECRAHSPNTELKVGFNKKIEETVAIKHSALKNELKSCLLACNWTLFPMFVPPWFLPYHPAFPLLNIQ